MPRELLVGEDLLVTRGEDRVLDVKRLELREGELLAVVGPNGSGKSTLLRVLAMLDAPDAGRVTYRGMAGRAAERALRRAAAAVLERPHFWRDTVGYNIGIGLRLRRRPSAEIASRVEKYAHLLGIGDLLDRDMGSLSGGQGKRVALARALILRPDILFLDEPSANLDEPSRFSFREDLERLARDRAGSIFLVTQDLREALSLADRITVLVRGRLVQTGTPTELFENPANPFVARLTGAELTLRGVVRAVEDGLLAIDLGGAEIFAVGDAAPGDTVKVAYRPEDLVLAPAEEPGGRQSARNVLYATILERRSVGTFVHLRLAGPQDMAALVTRASAEDLCLTLGQRISVRVSATALHAFPL